MRRFKAVATAIVTLMTGPGLCQTPLPPADHDGFADDVVETGRPIIRSDFDVYLKDKILVYVKDVCREEDIRAPFFLHVTPVDRNDLPADRVESGFERTRFRFERDGFRRGGPCILTYRLPDYPIRRLRTGQSAPETDRSWEAAHPPNLVFIMADDLGKGLLPLYNARVEVGTPNIERLAREGIVFDNAYATPVCLTTRAEPITGRYPVNNGLAGHAAQETINAGAFLDPQRLPSFANPLKHAGYATALAGKWHGKARYQSGRVLRAFGFDQWMLSTSQRSTYATTHEGRLDFEPSDFPADRLADFVIDFIEESSDSDRPFFVYYPMSLVHRPLVATPDMPGAESDSDKLTAMIEYADKMIGRVLDALEAHGVRDDTIVFFSGDNGVAVELRQGRKVVSHGKNRLTEAGVNVPFIVSGGPVARRGRTDALTDFTDVLPTLAALAGASVPDDYAPDGHSIADFLLGRAADTPRRWIASAAAIDPALDGGGWVRMPSGCRFSCNVPPVQGRDRLFWHAEDIGVVVRDKRYKLWHHGNGLRALFDLDRDSSESVNLWDSEEARAVAAKRRLLEVRRTLPEGDVYVRTGPLTPDYGLYSHWRLDRPVAGAAGRPTFADSVGGFHAEAGEAPMVAPGKLGNAPRTGSLHVARFSQFFRIRPSDLSSLTLSAWIRRDEGSTDEVTLLRLRTTPDEERSPLSLVGKTDGSIAVRHWGRGMSATPTGASDDGWIHVAFAWGSVAGGQEAVLYLDGEVKIRSTEFMPTPRSRSALPPGGWLEIGDDGVVVDDVAV